MSSPAERMNDSLLPPHLAEIGEACGMDVATALVEHWGGTRLYVPMYQTHADHPLVVTLGKDLADRLSEHCGGEHLEVPRCLAAVREARNREIRRLYFDCGWTQGELARRYRLTDRQIRTILSASVPDDSQQDLL